MLTRSRSFWAWYLAQRRRDRLGQPIPSDPSNLVVTVVNASGVTVGWQDNSNNETAFRVHASYDGGAFADTPADPPSDINPTLSNVTSYFLDVSQVGGGGQFELSYLRLRVRAENAEGESGWSNIVQVPPSVQISDVDARYDEIGMVDVLWSPTNEGGPGVQAEVYRRINNGAYVLLATVSVTTSTYPDHNDPAVIAALTASQPVDYYVRVTNSGGIGPSSNVATAHQI